MFKGKKILVGLCGGIAAYKTCSLVRELKKLEAEVRVIMTPAAANFVSPLIFSTLSGNGVVINMFPDNPSSNTSYSVDHISLSIWADVTIVAPATANTLAKLSHGFADNMLTSIILAARSPVIVAPSMDVDMYENPITQENIERLKKHGFIVVEPECGFLASGLFGRGRLPENDVLIHEIAKVFYMGKQDLKDKNILISAGPTQEFIDPVRFISNRSSGKMGFALAKAASLRGANVTLVTGPVKIQPPVGIKTINVISSNEMFETIKSLYKDNDVSIMAAAVSDFKPESTQSKKIKKEKNKSSFSFEFQKTQDILGYLGNKKEKQILIGFAVETDDEIKNAEDKLRNKNLDMIILNNPLLEGAGFDVDTNIVTILSKNGDIEKIDKKPKSELAHIILDRIIPLLPK
jgi:phosphopantothenoylcysteine decarboxylase / phosphopantothenate---cysteine ligase